MIEYDVFTGRKIKKRKSFLMQTKKKIWMKSRKSDPEKWRREFIKTSYCMNPRCRKKLNWDNKWSFEWDHKNNDPSNNSERNCYLVCNDCHKKHTVLKKVRTNNIVGPSHRTIKKKVGYKKEKKSIKRKKLIKKRKKKAQNIFPFG